jgi:hypothetical protein
MADDKRPDDGLLFTLRPHMSEEDARAYNEARRRIAAQMFAAFAPQASALAAMHERWAEAIERAACAPFNLPDCAGVALAVAQVYEEAMRAGAMIGAAFAGLVAQAEESARIFTSAVAVMPEDEREEWRCALEDAPLEPVDVNASGVM